MSDVPESPYRAPEIAVPPPPQPDIPWLGTTRFWLIALGVFLAVTLGLIVQMVRVSDENTLVAVVSLSGPTDPVPGERARYGVLVRDPRGAAVPHARVRLGFDWHGFRELGRAETGDDGSAAIDVTFPESFVGPEPISAIADVGLADARAMLVVERSHAVRGQVLISTDKPMYQPGQTVHIRALAMAGARPITNRAASVEVRTPDGTRVFQEEKTTSAFGVLSADFPLAEQVKLGNYQIRVITAPLENVPRDPGVDVANASIEVKRYSLPKLKLTFEDLGTLRPDAPFEGTAKATWIFGEPVTKGSVSVRLLRNGSTDRTKTGQLDKDGKFRFVLPAPDKRPDSSSAPTFALNASVQVEGGLNASVATLVEPFSASGIKIEAFPEGGTLIGRVEQTVFVVVTGSPRENVAVWPDHGKEVLSDAQGIARVAVNPQDPDVEIHARTPNGTTAITTLRALKEGLAIRPDLESYEAGAKARIRIVGAPAGDRVAARLMKGNTPLITGTCVVTNAADGCDLSIVVPEVSGLVWIQAVSMPSERGRELLNAKRLIMVAGGGRDLTLKVSTDKPVYAPRDIGTMTLDVTGAGGKPVKAGVGIAVADEAVFALGDVRPDLERQFFVVGQDMHQARREEPKYGGYHPTNDGNEKSLPAALDRRAIYDPNVSSSVRATILAILTTMPETEPLWYSTSSELRSAVRSTRDEQVKRLLAWCIVALAATSLAALALFGSYGVLRFRRRVPSASSAIDRQTFLLETRGLLTDWLLAVVAPIALSPFAIAGAAIFNDNTGGSSRDVLNTVFASWSVLALVGSFVLLRGVLRIRRTAVAAEVPALRRAVMLLPAAAFFGQLAVLFSVGDDARKVGALFDIRESRYLIAVFVVLGVQVVFGLLSVIRQSLLRPLSRRGAIWLFLSRATFIGLPVTLGFLIFFGYRIVHQERRSFAEAQEDDREEQQAPSYPSDNKEGGTGTRAKGEEGSMGNPNTASQKRYAVAAGDDKKDESPRVVRDWFPETLLWAPEIPTDDNGHLQLKVPFADSITTWRLGLRAVSGTGQIGSSATPLVVMQDFFVDAALPATLTQGDELAVPVTVYSYLERGQDVGVDLEGDGMSAVGNSHVTVHLEPKESRGFRFTVKADRAGERVVRIKASTGAHSDVEERKVIVVPNGKETIQTINARLVKSSKTEIALPASAIDGGNDLYAKIYGGPLSQVGEGLDGVFHLPHGCFEQTSSTTYPSILVLDFLERTKQVSPEVEKKARGYLTQGYQQLLSFEVKGGGFSLFGAAPADVALSAYGLLELADMARVTGFVDEDLLHRTSNWILGERSNNGMYATVTRDAWDRTVAYDAPLLTAYVAWALATAGALERTPDPRVNELLDRAGALSDDAAESPYGLALRMNALIAGKRMDAAKALGEKLAAKVTKNDEGIHWSSNTTGVLYSSGASHDIEVTGLATHALALTGQSGDLRSGALDWLVRLRGARGTWSTTQATIAAMRAMLDEAKPMPKEPQDVTIVVDGTPAGNVRLEPAARDVHHLVDLRRFATTGSHTIELKTPGEADVSYQVVATHWLPWTSPSRAALGLEVAYTSGPTTTVRAKLTWNGKLPAVMPLIEIPIPPSFEAETDDLEALLKVPGGVQRYTVSDGKITLYVTSIRADKPLVANVRLRSTRSARVIAPAAVAYLYYEPEVRTETAPVLVRVN